MLNEIRLENYRGHESTVVPLSRFTLLVGVNGAGKSSALEAVHLAGQTFSNPSFAVDSDGIRRLQRLFLGPRSLTFLRRRAADAAMAIDLRGTDSQASWRFRIEAPSDDPGRMTCSWSFEATRQEHLLHELPAYVRNGHVPQPVRHSQSAVMARLRPERLKEPSTSDDEEPRIEFDGYGLATVLQDLSNRDRVRFEQIITGLKAVVPLVESLRIQRVKVRRTQERIVTVDGKRVVVPEEEQRVAEGLEFKYRGMNEWLPAHTASDGTLIALGTLALLYQPRPARIVMLDDIDQALHPEAQGELVRQLRSILDFVPNSQIIATSHSPYLADSFKPEDVVVFTAPEQGVRQARRLSEHPDKQLLESLTTGEFLTASGKLWFWP